ncbi:MAG TPA: hypothetical protein VKD90_06960 [Gemmataceae bacterium]|nr:hypothetical protein [Gemmataceae bacterium]
MTPGGWTFPTGRALAVWRRQFPAARGLWAGHFLVWHVELPIQQSSPLAEWVARATALGPARPADLARRLGVPEPVVASILVGAPAASRRTFSYLDLPSGPRAVSNPPKPFAPWPEPVHPDRVPAAIFQPNGASISPRADDWRTVPVVRAGHIAGAAVRRGDAIQIYAADAGWAIGENPLWELPADALPNTAPADWTKAWRAWCAARSLREEAAVEVTVDGVVARVAAERLGGIAEVARSEAWLLAGDGPLRPAAVLEAGRPPGHRP